MYYPIVIIGAGAAGIGIGVLLKRLNLPFIILEQGTVGNSFLKWPKQTQFISPSFSGNAFGAVDLNAVTPDTSPAFSLYSEHPNGLAYSKYLQALVNFYDLPIQSGICVDSVKYDKSEEYPFTLETNQGITKSIHVIWAAGEFQYPNRHQFISAEHCIHYADIDSWMDLEGDEFSILGGYESGMDAAFQLVKLGKKVTIFDGSNQINKHSSDSSYTLSPFSRDRLSLISNSIKVVSTQITHIETFDDGYSLHTSDGEKYWSFTQPINCMGFSSSLKLVKHLFDFQQGDIQLSSLDESTICPNLFLSGPQVKHGEALFCFIYKFRQRFAIIAEELSKRLNGDETLRNEIIDYYKQKQFYMDDLSCCDEECSC